MSKTWAWPLLLGILVIAGCQSNDVGRQGATPRSEGGEATPISAVPTPVDVQPTSLETSALLAELGTSDRYPTGLPDYDRKAFGSRWSDTDRNGCNQRDDVLLRDAQTGTTRTQQQGRCDHDVVAGTWLDPYTGRTLTFTDLKDPKQSVAIQIDHIVPLAEAWRSGASDWSNDRRRQYANDLDNLLAVDGPTNASKSSYDPASWRPRQAFQCTYATRWIEVKHRWDLSADPSEVAALRDMLTTC